MWQFSCVYLRAERIDLITGSGMRGQTYLFWQGDRLFELPVSYWSDGHRWINSPGYIDGTADFSRPNRDPNPPAKMQISISRFVARATVVVQSFQKRSQLVEILESDDIFRGQAGW